MKADYIELSDGRQVRILWNMNALGEFTLLTGREMPDLAEGKADIPLLRTIAWLSAREGEAADGRDLELDEVGFGRLMSMAALVKFVEILSRQAAGAEQKKSSEKGRSPLMFFRRTE